MLRKHSAFTLVELLVVIAVIAVLVLLMLPAIQAAREAARMSLCKNNMRQMGLAMQNHEGAVSRLPAGWKTSGDPEGEPGWGWAAALLPYLEETALYSGKIDLEKPIDDPFHELARKTSIPIYICPSDPNPRSFMLPEGENHHHDHEGHEHEEDEEHEEHEEHEHAENADLGPAMFEVARSNYAGSFGSLEVVEQPSAGDGVFFHNSRLRFRSITDGLSKTIFVGERSSRLGTSVWVGAVHGARESMSRVVGSADHTPNSSEQHFEDFSSHHPWGAHFVMGDASVRLIADDIDPAVYKALSTRSGGESTGEVD